VEIALRRIGEAPQHAHHALMSTNGPIAHDAQPDQLFAIDNTKEIRLIEQALKLADIEFRTLPPLKA
jgi:hypothetical protein